MTNLFKFYAEEDDTMFATIEEGSKFCFTGKGHGMFDDEEEDKNRPMVDIWVVLLVR